MGEDREGHLRRLMKIHVAKMRMDILGGKMQVKKDVIDTNTAEKVRFLYGLS